MRPFGLEVFYGERVAVLGSNGSGKSHFLRLLAGEPVAHTGGWKLGARVLTGLFAQTHERPDLADRALVDILWRGDERRAGLDRGRAMAALRRYGLHEQADERFDVLSGGQQARLQVLLLELSGATCCCWTSRPTTSTWSVRRRCSRRWLVPGDGAGGDARPLVRALVRPVPGLRRGRRGGRVGRAGLGLGPGGAGALSRLRRR